MILTAKHVNMVKNLAKHKPLSARLESPLMALTWSGRLMKQATRSTPAKFVIRILSGVIPPRRFLKMKARIIEFATIPRKQDVPKATFCTANPGHWALVSSWYDFPSEKVEFRDMAIPLLYCTVYAFSWARSYRSNLLYVAPVIKMIRQKINKWKFPVQSILKKRLVQLFLRWWFGVDFYHIQRARIRAKKVVLI